MFAESLQKNFWGNARVSFKPFLLGICFWTRIYFRLAFCRTLVITVSLLIDGGVGVFTITRFMETFTYLLASTLSGIFLFCWADSFVGLHWLFFRKSPTDSHIFFFICLKRWFFSMLSSLIYLNKSFLDLDINGARK